LLDVEEEEDEEYAYEFFEHTFIAEVEYDDYDESTAALCGACPNGEFCCCFIEDYQSFPDGETAYDFFCAMAESDL
jgi:hypothetical protein